MPVIKQTRRVIVGPVGINRQSQSGEIQGNALAELAGNISNIAFKHAADYAEKTGTDAGLALKESSITTINPATGLPEAMKVPSSYGVIAAAAYEKVVRSRFENSIGTLLSNKALILENKYQDSSNPVRGFTNEYDGFLEGLVQDLGEDSGFRGTVERLHQEAKANGNTRLTIKKANRDRAEAAAYLLEQNNILFRKIRAEVAANGYPAAAVATTTEASVNATDINLAADSINLPTNGNNSNGANVENLVAGQKQAVMLGLFEHKASKLNRLDAEKLQNYLESGASFALLQDLPLSVQNSIREVEGVVGFDTIAKHSKDAVAAVREIAQTKTALFTERLAEDAAANESFVARNVFQIGDWSAFVEKNPSEVNNINTNLINAGKVHENAALKARTSQIKREEFNAIDNALGNQIGLSFVALANGQLGKLVSMDTIETALGSLETVGTMTTLMGLEGMPTQASTGLHATILETYNSLDTKGRETADGHIKDFFTNLKAKKGRNDDAAKVLAQKEVLNNTSNFTLKPFNGGLADIGMSANIVIDLFKQNEEAFSPDAADSNNDKVSALYVNAALDRISEVNPALTTEQLLTIEDYVKNGTIMVDSDGNKIALPDEVEAQLTAVRKAIGGRSNSNAVGTAVNSWFTTKAKISGLQEDSIADANSIIQIDAESFVLPKLNLMETSTHTSDVDLLVTSAFKNIEQYQDTKDPQERQFYSDMVAKIKTSRARGYLASALSDISLVDAQKIQVYVGGKRNNLAIGFLEGNREKREEVTTALGSDYLTAGDIKSATDLAVTRLEKQERITQEIRNDRNFQIGMTVGSIPQGKESQKRFSDILLKQHQIDINDPTNAAYIMGQIVSGAELNDGEKFLAESLPKIIPESFMGIFASAANNEDVSQTFQGLTNEAVLNFYDMVSHSYDTQNRTTMLHPTFRDGKTLDEKSIAALDMASTLKKFGRSPAVIAQTIKYFNEVGLNVTGELENTAKLLGGTSHKNRTLSEMMLAKLSSKAYNIYSTVLNAEARQALDFSTAAMVSAKVPSAVIFQDIEERLNGRVFTDAATISSQEGNAFTFVSINSVQPDQRSTNIMIGEVEKQLKVILGDLYGTEVEPLLINGKIPEDDSSWMGDRYDEFSQFEKIGVNIRFGYSPAPSAILETGLGLVGELLGGTDSKKPRIKFVAAPNATSENPIFTIAFVDKYGEIEPLENFTFNPHDQKIKDAILNDQRIIRQRILTEPSTWGNIGSLWNSLNRRGGWE